MRRHAALIVGGGPAGTAAAIALARTGTRALLLERTRETGDALCGGFLSWRTLETLGSLGVEADALSRERVTRVRLFAGGRTVEASLPRPAVCVSRRRLDTLLLDRVEAVERGIGARAAEVDGIRLNDGATVAADALFLATGKHDLRGLARPGSARGSDPALGLRVRLAPAPGLDALVADTIELHLFDRGYVGIARQEDGSVNLCMAVHRSRLTKAGSPAALLATLGNEHPCLGERLAYMASGAAIDAVANVPYGWRQRSGIAGLFRLGDQAGVIPSLAGEGMGIAIASGIAAARALSDGGPDAARTWQPAFARAVHRPIGVAGIVRAIGEGPLAPLLVAAARPALIQIVARLTRIGHRGH